MELELSQIAEWAVKGARLLEGEYKWYVIAGVALLLTGLLTKFIFKTIKWFVILILVGAGVGFVIWFIARLADLT